MKSQEEVLEALGGVNMLAKTLTTFSFGPTLKIADLPVITLYNGEQPLNFILDTGSDTSYINESDIDWNKFTIVSKRDRTMIHVGGTTKDTVYSRLVLLKDADGNDFPEVFEPTNMQSQFDAIEQETGIRINGLLGTTFFKRYQMVVDYETMTLTNKQELTIIDEE